MLPTCILPPVHSRLRRASRLFVLVLLVLAISRSVFGQTPTSAVMPATPTWVDAVTGIITIPTSPGHAAANGTVTYSVDGGTTGTRPVSNGAAYLQLGQLSIGSHTLTSSYAGDGVYPASTPAPVTFSVVDTSFAFISTESVTAYDSETILGMAAIALDPHDTVYFSYPTGNNIQTLNAIGQLANIPITGLSNPQGLIFDGAGNLFIADQGNDRIVEYTAAGVQSALSIPGLGGPTLISIDRTRNLLFIADPDNQRIVRYDLIAGGALVPVATGLTNLVGMTVDPSGNLYYSDKNLGYQRVDPSGNVVPIYVNISYLGGYIGGIFADRKGYLYITDTGYGVVLRIDQQGHQTRINSGDTITQLADDSKGRIYLNRGYNLNVISPGLGKLADFVSQDINSSYNNIQYAMPSGVSALTATFAPSPAFTLSSSGSCSYLSRWGICYSTTYVRAALPGQHLGYTVASIPGASIATPLYGNALGSIAAFSPGTPATSATGATVASGVAYDQLGNYYASDATGNRVLETTAGTTSTLSFSGLSHPTALAVDAFSAVYVLDSGDKRIVRLDTASNQTVPVVAGTGNSLSTITAFAVDGACQIYFAGDNSIYFLNQSGATSLVASGLGTSAALSLDPTGNLYSLQQDGSLIRIDIFGVQKTLAAAGTFASPSGLAVDPSMTAYVAQSGTPAITLVHPDLTTFSLPVTGLGHAVGIAIDGRGSILAADSVTNQFTFVDRSHQDFNFGDVPVNTMKTFTAYLLNSGTSTSIVTGVPGDSNFRQVTTSDACLTSPATTSIPSAGSCNLSYTVMPTTIGTTTDYGRVTTTDMVDFDAFTYNAVGVATLTPDNTSLMLADTSVGSTSTAKVFTITNTGSGPAMISSVSNSDIADFSETDTCSGATIAVNATCTVTVTFHPATANMTSMSTITIASNASNPSLQLAISGHSPAVNMPQAMLAPTALSFNAVAGNTSGTQVATLSNNGSATLTISSIAVTGANASVFTENNTCGNSLAAGSSCNIFLAFSPSAVGTDAATLVVTDNAGSSTPLPTVARPRDTISVSQTIALTGIATGTAQAVLSPASAIFGALTIGTTSATQTFTLTNQGNASLSVTSASLSGSGASAYTINSNKCPSALAAGASCAIAVTFAPTTAGTFTATLSVTDAVGTQSATLTGTGTTAATPQAALTPAKANFGSVTSGSTSAAQTFTLSNAGTAALPIASVSLSGTDTSVFKLATNGCGSSLAAGASCTIAVTFAPTSVASFTATLSVMDSVGTQTSALSGAGTATSTTGTSDFTIAATPATQSSYRGTTVSYPVQLGSVSNTSPFTSAVALSIAGLPAGATAAFSPASVTPGTGVISTLTVTIPSLYANNTPQGKELAFTGISAAAFLLFLLPRRKRLPVRLLLMLCALGLLSAGAIGCGSGNGFAVPTSNSTLVITGTSGTTTHTTSVSLTVQ